MIDAVLMFGFLNVLFEFILVSMITPRARLRLLGSERLSAAMHIGFLIANLFIHWGTLIGTMAGILAFVSSIATLAFARQLYGHIKEGRFYHVGWRKYCVEDLK